MKFASWAFKSLLPTDPGDILKVVLVVIVGKVSYKRKSWFHFCDDFIVLTLVLFVRFTIKEKFACVLENGDVCKML